MSVLAANAMVNAQSKQPSRKPIAVVAGDIHYSLSNLVLADTATRMAITKANELNVPFISNGDLSDTKAILRAECVNAMIKTFQTAKIKPIANIGNHSLINTRGKEHALHFLAPYAKIVDTPVYLSELNVYMSPYQDKPQDLINWLETLPTGSTVFLHQGIKDALSGEYTHDHSAIDKRYLASFRTILSHYHRHQTIDCGAGGEATYIGSPYSMSYGEADDGPKGYGVLMSDGSLEFVPTNLRKHVKLEVNYADEINHKLSFYTDEDLIWLKVCGPRDVLANFDSSKLIRNCRVEFVYKENTSVKPETIQLSDAEQLDRIINGRLEVSEEGRERIKKMWKEF